MIYPLVSFLVKGCCNATHLTRPLDGCNSHPHTVTNLYFKHKVSGYRRPFFGGSKNNFLGVVLSGVNLINIFKSLCKNTQHKTSTWLFTKNTDLFGPPLKRISKHHCKRPTWAHMNTWHPRQQVLRNFSRLHCHLHMLRRCHWDHCTVHPGENGLSTLSDWHAICVTRCTQNSRRLTLGTTGSGGQNSIWCKVYQ